MRAGKSYVLGNTDDSGPRITPRSAVAGWHRPNPHPDRIPIRRDVSSQRATHDNLVRNVASGLGWGQRRAVAGARLGSAAGQYDNATRPEVAAVDPRHHEVRCDNGARTVWRVDDNGVTQLNARRRQHPLGCRGHTGNLGETSRDRLANRRDLPAWEPGRNQD